jgi:hypothetical protein
VVDVDGVKRVGVVKIFKVTVQGGPWHSTFLFAFLSVAIIMLPFQFCCPNGMEAI